MSGGGGGELPYYIVSVFYSFARLLCTVINKFWLRSLGGGGGGGGGLN